MGPLLRYADSTIWKAAYQRNNKSNGQKNLRCFPECTEGKGHSALFCGRSVKVEYFPEDSYEEDDIALSQFTIAADRTSSEQILNLPTKVMLPYDLLQPVDGKELKRLLRTKANPMGELMPGRVCNSSSPESIGFEFNPDLRGWHYGFVGNKGTRSIQHALYAYILRKTNSPPNAQALDELEVYPPIYDTTYKVIAVVRSPTWTISCRRRNKSTGELPASEARLTPKPSQQPLVFPVNNQQHIVKEEHAAAFALTGLELHHVKTEAQMQPMQPMTEPVVKPVVKRVAKERNKFNVRRQESQERVAASGRSIYAPKRCMGVTSPEPVPRRKLKTFGSEPSEASNLQNVVFKLLTLVLLPLDSAPTSHAAVELFSGQSPASFTLELIDILINWRQRTTLELHVVSQSICQQSSGTDVASCFSTYLLRQPEFWHAVDRFVEGNELSSKLDPQTTTGFILELLTKEYRSYQGHHQASKSQAHMDDTDCTELSPPRSLPFARSFAPQPADFQMQKTCLKPVCGHYQCSSTGLCQSPLLGLRKPESKPDLSFLCFEYQNKCVVDETDALINHLLTPNSITECPAAELNNRSSEGSPGTDPNNSSSAVSPVTELNNLLNLE